MTSYPAPVYVKSCIKERLFDALKDQPYSVYLAAVEAVNAGYSMAEKEWNNGRPAARN